MKTKGIFFALLSVILLYGQSLYAHCQIPCGIYDDEMRIKMISEHIDTIEKSMKQITELSKENPPNWNQLVRWVTNKDAHADEIHHIVAEYFMAQRIPVIDPQQDKKKYEDNLSKLDLLHQMLVVSMKAKQTVDLSHVEKLRSLLEKFKAAYFTHQ